MGANAQTSVPAFTAGQVLTAAQVTGINTGIPVFASSTERDAAFGGTGEKTLAEGQMAYLEDTNATQYYDGSSWAAIAGGKILQVVSTFVDTVFSTTSTSFVDVTGHTVTITPSAATSKVYVVYTALTYHTNTGRVRKLNLLRDGTNIAQPSGGSAAASMNPYMSASLGAMHATINFLDSPATTSAVVYKIQVATDVGTVSVGGDAGVITSPASLTVMEVSA